MTIDSTTIYEIQELTDRQKELIKASIPILEQAGDVLTSKFYTHMLTDHPEVKPFFKDSDQKLMRQPKILAFALLNYAKNIDDISPLTDFVNQVVVKHVGLQVKPEHYPIVGKCLLDTMRSLLGEETATDEFLHAWATAYGNLAQILINAEQQKYKQNAWDGFRDFKVTRIADESKNVKSVYFAPVDDGKIALPQRGQYVCIRWQLPNLDHETSREYSLSAYPKSNEYRISVRLLEGGQVSGYIHSDLKVGTTICVAPPSGQFTYRENEKPVVLFVGGIGITPLVSITEYALENGREVIMFYSNKTVETRPFTDWLHSLKKNFGDKFKLKEYFSNDKTSSSHAIDELEARALGDHDFEFIKTKNNDYDLYLLGPSGYMGYVKKQLVAKGVDESLIASEFFGPVEV